MADDSKGLFTEMISTDVNEQAVDLLPTKSALLVILILLGGIVYAIENGFLYIALAVIGGFYVTAFSTLYTWNKLFHTQGYAPAPMIAHLAAGGLFIFGLAGAFTFLELQLGILLSILLSTLVALVYEYGIVTIALRGWDRDNIEFGKHPDEDDNIIYAFKEELYISIIEKEALKKANSN